MKRLFIALLVLLTWLAFAFSSDGSLSLVSRETFIGVGTLNSNSPGNLGTVAGTFAKRPGGPRLTSDTSASSYGWSGDVRGNAAYGLQSVNGTTFNVASQWVFLTAVPDTGTGRFTYLLRTQVLPQHGYDFLSVGVLPNGNIGTYSQNNTTNTPQTDSGIVFPLYSWVELRVAWRQISSGVYQKGIYFRMAGANTWTTLVEETSQANIFGDGLGNLTFGVYDSSAITPHVRIGMCAIYAMSSWADRLTPAPGVADPAGPYHWYCNPATGNDANDGTSAATAWASVAQINTESINLGMIPTLAGYAAGDTLTIDTSAANLTLGTTALNLYTRGLNVVQVGGGEIQAWTPMASSSWSLVSGAAKTYQHTLTESEPSCVVWENDKWLNKVYAPTFTGSANNTANSTITYSNVTAALEAVPGSFWTDGTTLYVHPFGDTNPASDGKIYTRSYHRNAPYGDSAVLMLAPDQHLNGLRVRKTTLAVKDTNDPVLAYCIQMNGLGGGTSLIENCVCSYGSKHIYGFTDSSTARRLTVRNCTADQGSPYVGSGGQTPWVDYSSLSADADNQTVYDTCSTTATSGLIGSTTGQSVLNGFNVWLSHNNGSGRQFSLLKFVNCRFDCSLAAFDSIRPGGLQLVDTACGGLSGYAMGMTVDRCTSTYSPFLCQGTGGSMTVTNSLVRSNAAFYYFSSSTQCAGTIVYKGCTIDLSAAGSGNAASGGDSLLARTGALKLTIQDCLFISRPSGYSQLSIVNSATNADTLSFDHNAYLLGNNRIVVGNYNDGSTTANRTLAQVQALGIDTNSTLITDAYLDAQDRPLSTSPVIDAGIDLGSQADLSGTFFTVRNDVGAYEYPLPVLRTQPQSAGPLTEGGSVSFGVQAVGNGPFTYQWRYNGAAIAGATGSTLTLNNLLPGQSGSYTVVVSNAQGSVTSQTAVLLVQPLSYSQWLAAHFTSGEQGDPTVSGPTADPDADGLANLLEYASGGNPRLAETGTGLRPHASLQADGDGLHLALTYRRLINNTQLTYAVESSSDLVTWDGTGGAVTTIGSPVATGDGRTEWVTCRLQVPLQTTAGGKAFLRLRVSTSP